MVTVLLIIASSGFQPIEYHHTRAELEKVGIKVRVASDAGVATAAQTQEKVTAGFTLDQIFGQSFDGIFIIGGPGALDHLDNENVYAIMRSQAAAGRWYGAICVSPRILAKAGLLKDKQATGWNGDGKLEKIFSQHGVNYVQKPVVVDGRCITADGPTSATDFGKIIAQKMMSK